MCEVIAEYFLGIEKLCEIAQNACGKSTTDRESCNVTFELILELRVDSVLQRRSQREAALDPEVRPVDHGLPERQFLSAGVVPLGDLSVVFSCKNV